MSLAQFRYKYPQGSLVGELVEIDRGTYIVKAIVQTDGVTLATGLASGTTVEAAEDAARERAIATLFLEPQQADLTSTAQSQPEVIDSPAPVQSEIDSPNLEPEIARKPEPVGLKSKELVETVLSAEPSPPPTPQLELEPDIINSTNTEPESSESNNLFGDALSVETPEVSPLFAERPQSSTVETATVDSELDAMDFNEIKQKTDIEIKRLGWTKDRGKEFLMSRYGKRSRLHLTDEQLLEFLRYLEQLPNPVA